MDKTWNLQADFRELENRVRSNARENVKIDVDKPFLLGPPTYNVAIPIVHGDFVMFSVWTCERGLGTSWTVGSYPNSQGGKIILRNIQLDRISSVVQDYAKP